MADIPAGPPSQRDVLREEGLPVAAAIAAGIFDTLGPGAYNAILPLPQTDLHGFRDAFKAVYDGPNLASWEGMQYALLKAFRDRRLTNPTLGIGEGEDYLVHYTKPFRDLKAFIGKISSDAVPNFAGFLRDLAKELSVKVDEKVVLEFDTNMSEALIKCVSIAILACQDIDADMAGWLRGTANRRQNPSIDVIQSYMLFIMNLYTKTAAVIAVFTNVQLPMHIPVTMAAARQAKIIDIPAYMFDIPFTKFLASSSADITEYLHYASTSALPGIRDATRNAALKLRKCELAPLIAVRTWTSWKNLLVIPHTAPLTWLGGAKAENGVANGAVTNEMANGMANGSDVMLGGGKGKGSERDAATERMTINGKFGKKFFDHLGGMAEEFDKIAADTSMELINFFSDAAVRPLVGAIADLRVPSRGYIPTLSGYYRTPEAKFRRDRYISSLKAFSQAVTKYTGTSYKIGASARASLIRAKSEADAIVKLIETTNREMEEIFAKVAHDQLAAITADDSTMSRGIGLGDEKGEGEIKEPDAYETAGFTGESHVHLGRSIENIKAVSSMSAARKSVLTGLTKLDDYLKNGKGLIEETIAKRLEELHLSYQSILGQVDAAQKPLAKKVIQYKERAYRDFYDALAKVEIYLAKSHKALLASPAIRDELYKAIAQWTLATQVNATLDDKFRTSVAELVKEIFPGNAAIDVFNYDANGLQVRELGAAGREKLDGVLYDTFLRKLLATLNYNPRLQLVFKLVNIFEKVIGKGYDSKELYSSAVHFILASSVDVCRGEEALQVKTGQQNRTDGINLIASMTAAVGAVGALVYVPPRDGFTLQAATEGTNLAAVPVLPAPAVAKATAVGVFFRHVLGTMRLEDAMFVRWMKAICANMLLALDRDRATHGIKKVNLPGAERLLIGAGLDDPIGLTGSKSVIPEATPIYIGFPIACRAYEIYFTWDGNKDIMPRENHEEPRMVVELPKDSRFYTVLELVRGRKSKEALSETYISQMVAALNDVWGHFSHISDTDRRVSAIFDSFFDEINNSIVLRMLLDNEEVRAKQELDRDAEAITGIIPVEDEVRAADVRRMESYRMFRQNTLNALKGIGMSVFDIMARVGTSEEAMASDYKTHVERVQKRITDVQEHERFRELVRALQSPDETIGDIQGLFMAFVEFVVTPLFFIVSITENFVYRAANLYMLILRYLFSARTGTNFAAGGITNVNPIAPAGAGGGTTLARAWFLYDLASRMSSTSPDNSSHAGRIAKVLKDFTFNNFNPGVALFSAFAAAGIGGAIGTSHTGNATIDNALGVFRANANPDSPLFIHMHQPIYKALHLLLDVGREFIDLNKKDIATVPTAIVEAGRFIAFIDDAVTSLKASLGVFMKIGNRETTEPYFRDISGWEPKAFLQDIMGKVNAALGIVKCDFAALREYLPNAIGYDQVAAAPGKWVVNFRRNSLLNDNNTKALLNYQEAVAYIIGSPSNWGAIKSAMQGGAGVLEATAFTEEDWSKLDPTHGIFTPLVKVGVKVGAGTALLPWTSDDSKVIEGGWEEPLASGQVGFGPAINTPALFSGIATTIASGGYSVHGFNSGGWIHTLPAATPANVQLGFVQHISGAAVPADLAIGTVNTGPIVQSLLYGRPGYCSKAETFNRLLAKTAAVLTLQAENPVVLFDLAKSIGEHSGMAPYFTSNEVTVPGSRPDLNLTFTTFPNTIGAPLHVSGSTYMCHNNGFNWIVTPDGVPSVSEALAESKFKGLANSVLVTETARGPLDWYVAVVTPDAAYKAVVDALAFSTSTQAKVREAFEIILIETGVNATPEADAVRSAAGKPVNEAQADDWGTALQMAAAAALGAANVPAQASYQNIIKAYLYTFTVKEAGVQIPNAAGDGKTAPEYKHGTFVYDAMIAPFHNSVKGVTQRRIGEMSDAEISQYLAAIPQLLTAFKNLKSQIRADETLGLATNADFTANGRVGSPLGVSHTAGNPDFQFNDLPADLVATSAIVGIRAKLYDAACAMVESLADCYKELREKYGNPVHMEMVKGEFEPYFTAGKFDTTKIITPMSIAAVSTLVGERGPVALANFGERGSRHTQFARALAWATPVLHKELVSVEVVPLECVPWTVSLAERLKKMVHGSLDTVLQPAVTMIAKLICMQNRMDLAPLACYSPWGTHSIPSVTFHPHIMELHHASMNAGVDLFRGTDPGQTAHDNDNAHHFLVEMAIPWLALNANAHPALRETVFDDATLLGTGGVGLAFGTWVNIPIPIVRADANHSMVNAQAIKVPLTANPFKVKGDGRGTELFAATGAIVALTQKQTLSANGAFVALHITGRLDTGGNAFVDWTAANMADGEYIGWLIKQLRDDMEGRKFLTEKSKHFYIDRFQAFGSKIDDNKIISKWVSRKSKAKLLIKEQLGFDTTDPSNKDNFDGNYTEMVKFSPPKARWQDSLPFQDRHMASFFMYRKRNPLSIISLFSFAPFPAIYAHSEAFDLYFQLAANRNMKTEGSSFIRSYVPSLITEPYNINSNFTNFDKTGRKGKAYIVNYVKPAIWANFDNKSYKDREVAKGTIAAALPAGVDIIYQSFRPYSSSIAAFYGPTTKADGTTDTSSTFTPYGGGAATGLAAPSDAAINVGQGLVSFPLFAMNVRMLDQYGIILKDELATRLREVKYDRPDSLAQHESALIGVLEK